MSSKQNIFYLWKNLFIILVVVIISSIVLVNLAISGMEKNFESNYLTMRNESIYRLIKSVSIDYLILQDKSELRFILKDLVDENPYIAEIMVYGVNNDILALVTGSSKYKNLTVFSRSISYSHESFGSMTIRWDATAELAQIAYYQIKMRIFYSTLVFFAVALVVFFVFRKAIQTCSDFVEVDYLSKHDSLTGLANRRELERYMEDEIARSTHAGISCAIILFDIDYFKLYNDTLGHQEGDECLKHVAGVIQKLTHRHSDIAARFGGEEFMVVLTDVVGDGKELAQRYLEAVYNLNIKHEASEVDSCVTLSAGVSICHPKSGLSVRDYIKQADDALYAAKRLGRNRVITFSEYEKGLYCSENMTDIDCTNSSNSYQIPAYAR